MYCGAHALTVIEIPGKEMILSRDLHLVDLQSVIEIDACGKYIVYGCTITYQREGDLVAPVELRAPYEMHRLSVQSGDLDGVETEARYVPGVEPRPGVEEVRPTVRAEIGPPDHAQVPVLDAAALHTDIDAVQRGALSKTVRKRLAAATVFVECIYTCGAASRKTSGTGFFVSPRGHIVTNNHVVSPTLPDQHTGTVFSLSDVDITVHGDDGPELLKADVIVQRDKPDLALLKVEGGGYDFLCLEPSDVDVSDPVHAIGYPGGRRLDFTGAAPPVVSFRAGHLTAVRESDLPGHNYYEHSAPMEQGNSGGPLITPRGTMVGVNTLLAGPQWQSRIATSKDTVRAFLFQQTAEGKGAYFGPSPYEAYATTIARVNGIWGRMDAAIGQYTGELLHLPDGTEDSGSVRERVRGTCLDGIETYEHLAAALAALFPPERHRLNHAKLLNALRTQIQALQEIVALMLPDAEDQYLMSNQRDRRTSVWDRDMEVAGKTNDLQDGRTMFCYAVNRIIGMYWASNEQISSPPPPVRIPARMGPYSREHEQYLLNELANVFQRHRGGSVLILNVQFDQGVREIVYQDALVSGSPAMLREMRNVVSGNGWDKPRPWPVAPYPRGGDEWIGFGP